MLRGILVDKNDGLIHICRQHDAAGALWLLEHSPAKSLPPFWKLRHFGRKQGHYRFGQGATIGYQQTGGIGSMLGLDQQVARQ